MPQREAVWHDLKGGSRQLVAELIEVESGTRLDRPTLQEAARRNPDFVKPLSRDAAVLILVDGGEAEGPHRLGKGLGG